MVLTVVGVVCVVGVAETETVLLLLLLLVVALVFAAGDLADRSQDLLVVAAFLAVDVEVTGATLLVPLP